MAQVSDPTVSIIIPCYNAEPYLAETLDSVLNQTFSDFEIIAVDDGSTDNTLSILQEYATKECRLKIITQKNLHVAQARINGISQAKGKYLLCLDSDDKLASSYLEKCVLIAENNPSISIVYSKARFFDSVEKTWHLPDFTLKSFLLINCIFVSALIRKVDYDKVGGFDSNLNMVEDWELFLSIIKLGGRVHRIDEELFFYRQRKNGSSIMNNVSLEEHSDSMLYIYSKHYSFYKQNGIYLQDLFNAKIKLNEKYNKWWLRLFYRLFNYKKYIRLYS